MELWPDLLLASVNMMLGTGLPMQLFYGMELWTIQNDALAAPLDERAERGLGQPARVFWHDAWPVVGELLDGVYRSDVPVRHSNALITHRGR